MASRIGELLVKGGVISEAQLTEALKYQEGKGRKLGEILIELGYITTRELVCMLSEQVSIPFVELRPEMLDTKMIMVFPERDLYELCALPLYETDKTVFVAIGDPTNLAQVKALSKFTKKEIVVSGADPGKIQQLLDQIFLAELAEPILTEDAGAKPIVIEITDQTAVIQQTSRDGQAAVRKVPATVIITLGRKKIEDEHGCQ